MGVVALVDDEDFEWLIQWNWRSENGYAVRDERRWDIQEEMVYDVIRMHRVITGAPDGLEVDHKNGLRWDNRRKNIRVCEGAKNAMNRKLYASSSTGFKGVYLHQKTGKFMARIGALNARYYLGLFITPELAYEAYTEAARKHHGEFSRLI